MQRRDKIVILAVVASLLLLGVGGKKAFVVVRSRIRLARSRKAFAARQIAARHAAGLRFMAQMKQRALLANDPDNKVLLKSEHPASLEDEKHLKGRTLWVAAGGQLDYYRYTGRAIDFSHSEGILLGAQKLLVKDAVEERVPASAAFPIPQGEAQILLIFTLPDQPRRAGEEFAVAVGYKEEGVVNVLTDQIMFYDDPHTLYAYWGPQVWQAIDEHRVILGMTEHQVQLALGEVSMPRGDIMGNREIEYENLGRPMLVTFGNSKQTDSPQNSKVTKIVDETQ